MAVSIEETISWGTTTRLRSHRNLCRAICGTWLTGNLVSLTDEAIRKMLQTRTAEDLASEMIAAHWGVDRLDFADAVRAFKDLKEEVLGAEDTTCP